MVTKSINSLRCGAECLKYHTASWRWGIYKEQIIVVNHFLCSEFSDLSCFFKALSHSSCYEPHSHTSPRHSTGHSPGLDPGCLLSPRLNRSH